MHVAEGAIASVRLVDDHPQAVDVDDLTQYRALAPHLFVDAVQVLLARLDTRLNLVLEQHSVELLLDLFQEFLLIAARSLQCALEYLIALRVEGLESQVLELELHVVEAEPLGDWRIDLEGLACYRPASRRRHRFDGAHVVGAVC